MSCSDPWNLDTNLTAIRQQWVGFFALCEKEEVFRASSPEVSAWDVGQHVKHCAIALNRIVDAIEYLIANPEEGVGLGPSFDFVIPMLESGEIPRGMGKAIEFLIPEANPDRADTRAMVEHAQAVWDGLSKRRADLAATQATFAHFRLGNFTAVQWARFMAVHTAHHFKIVRDDLDAAGVEDPVDAGLRAV
jgi:hypothetical protein